MAKLPYAPTGGKRPFRMLSGVSSLSDLIDGVPNGVGNVYFVVNGSTDTNVYNKVIEYQQTYSDGSVKVHTTIQSALDATVECRNDYVYVWPSNSDYDITAALTMTKKSVHLICLSGLGYDVGATNACRIHQTASAAIFAISDADIEIAGFYLKPYADKSHITVAATSYALNIHHNFFTLNWASAPEPCISCSGDGGAWGMVSHRNLFESMSGDDVTCASMITINSQATGARVEHNHFMLGDGNTATIAINNAAVKGITNFNTFMKAGTDGGYTHCIAINGDAAAIGNRGAVADSVLVTGGTNDASFSDNMNGVNGGLIDDSD